jgi:hypothetical protein
MPSRASSANGEEVVTRTAEFERDVIRAHRRRPSAGRGARAENGPTAQTNAASAARGDQAPRPRRDACRSFTMPQSERAIPILQCAPAIHSPASRRPSTLRQERTISILPTFGGCWKFSGAAATAWSRTTACPGCGTSTPADHGDAAVLAGFRRGFRARARAGVVGGEIDS